MTEQQNGAGAPSGRKLWLGVGVAIVAAVLILIVFVLPAERGVDLTGAGAATGLNALAPTAEMTELERGALRTGVLGLQDTALRTLRREFLLEPFEAIEFKFTLAQGAPLVFSWRATDAVNYDLHSHPFEGGVAMTEGYGVGDAREQTGLYVAAFDGIHGWYWQNRTLEPVTLTLNAAGYFSSTVLSDERGDTETDIPPAQ